MHLDCNVQINIPQEMEDQSKNVPQTYLVHKNVCICSVEIGEAITAYVYQSKQHFWFQVDQTSAVSYFEGEDNFHRS